MSSLINKTFAFHLTICGRILLAAGLFCALASSLQAASPERSSIELKQLREFAQNTREHQGYALLYMPQIHCALDLKNIHTCLRDFAEVKDQYFSLQHRQVALRFDGTLRIFELLGCLKDLGYSQIKILHHR